MCAPMPRTCTSILVHYVSTKNRIRSIEKTVQPRLWSYMGGIARTNKMKAIAVGGFDDHAHILLQLPTTITIAKAIQIDQGRFLKMDARGSWPTVLCMAGGVRSVYGRHLTVAINRQLHPEPGKAPQQDRV